MQKISLYLKLVNYIPLVVIAIFILILTIGGMFLFPKFSRLNEIKDSIQVKEIELQYKKEYLDNLGELKVRLDESTPEISKISSALPSDESIPSIFKFIQETASISGIVLGNMGQFTINPFEGNAEINEISFSIDLVGTYSSLKEFLSVLEKSSRLFEVRNLSFNQNEEEDTLNISLSLMAFSY